MKLILTRKLLRDLWGWKMILLALILVMGIGVGGYIGMGGVYRDMENARLNYFERYRLADFGVSLKRAPEWTADEVLKIPGVAAARGRVHLTLMLDLPGVEEPISGTAISMPKFQQNVLNDIYLVSGGWFTGRSDQEVILNDSFARENGLRPGHRIKATLLDKQHNLLIVGTAMSPEFIYLISPGGGLAPDPARFGVMYLPEDFLQEAGDLQGSWNEIIGTLDPDAPFGLEHTLTLVEERLDAYGVIDSGAMQERISIRFFKDELTGLQIGSKIMPSIFLGVAALALNILLGRIVAQQRGIIGTLRALGFFSSWIIIHYLSYGMIVGALGGLFGMTVGRLIQGAYCDFYRTIFSLPGIRPHFYPGLFFQGLGISILFAVLGTFKGVRTASALQPAEAMRPPPPEKGNRILLEYIPILWNPVPFRWKLIFRTVFRNPFRSTVSVVAAAISTGLIFMAMANLDAMNYMMSFTFEKVSHEDVTLSLREPAGRRAPSEVKAMPAVARVEPQLNVACDFFSGPYKKRTGVIGLVQSNSLFTPLDKRGNPVMIPQNGLVLSKKLAEILHVKPGDVIRMRPLIARREEVMTPVVSVVETYFGLAAYADIHYLSRLLGESWVANSILGTNYPGGAYPQFLSEVERRPAIIGIGQRTRSLEQIDRQFGDSIGVMLTIMIFLSGSIAFGSVLTATLVSLSERQREVGTLRVLGYSTLQVSEIFSGESFLLNAIGIFCGFGVGVGLSHLIASSFSTELYRFPVVINPSRFFIAGAIMLVFVAVAQLIVYRLVSRLDWKEVMQVKE
jgi:putative ABC transport system permease protein